jgi:hypothetical protein
MRIRKLSNQIVFFTLTPFMGLTLMVLRLCDHCGRLPFYLGAKNEQDIFNINT